MAKKHRKADISDTQQVQNIEVIPTAGKKWILAGVGLLVVGFFTLTQTDPHGRNVASHLAPFLMLSAYEIIVFGILFAARIDLAHKPAATPSAAP